MLLLFAGRRRHEMLSPLEAGRPTTTPAERNSLQCPKPTNGPNQTADDTEGSAAAADISRGKKMKPDKRLIEPICLDCESCWPNERDDQSCAISLAFIRMSRSRRRRRRRRPSANEPTTATA